MPSNLATWFKTPIVVGATQVAAATLASLGIVSYTTGNTYQAGTQEVTTSSGATNYAGGGLHITGQLSGAPCQISPVTGRYFDCVQESTLANTGSCVAAGCTGAGKSYHVASFTKPFTGSGVIESIEVNCDGLGKSSTLYASQVAASSTISGNTLFTNVKTATSGALIVVSTGSTMWAETTPAIRIYAGSRLGVGATRCNAIVKSHEMYNP